MHLRMFFLIGRERKFLRNARSIPFLLMDFLLQVFENRLSTCLADLFQSTDTIASLEFSRLDYICT